MPSTFSWLDYSQHERQRALEIVRQFEENGTVDELGVGTVRDALSDRLFPGISTIQSRARYFLFIPWIYLDLERRRVGSDRIEEAARSAEIGLIDSLAESDDPRGTIGIRARSQLKALPSQLYWAGLRTLGILNFSGSRDAYHRSLDAFYRLPASSGRNDDGEAVEGRPARNWHANLPPAPDDFPGRTSLTLTRQEASYLSERIAMTQPRSLMAWLTSVGGPSPDAEFPWDHRQASSFPVHNRIELVHARNFSELMHGSALLYNYMLAEKRGHDEWRADYQQWIEEWVTMLGERHQQHRQWVRSEFWRLIDEVNPGVKLPTRHFVNTWLDLALSPEITTMMTAPRPRQLIIARELQLKKQLARLTHQRPLELWGGASGVSRMDYRWVPVARDTIEDIQRALGRTDA